VRAVWLSLFRGGGRGQGGVRPEERVLHTVDKTIFCRYTVEV